MNRLLTLIFSIGLLCIFISCQSNKPMLSKGVSQGISGQILWYEGDLMPGINKDPVEGKSIKREIYIYEAAKQNQGDVLEGVFYSNIATKLVATTMTDDDGKFFIRLEPGTYSIFVKEPLGLFANRFNEEGLINPITIGINELTNMVIRVDYKAAY